MKYLIEIVENKVTLHVWDQGKKIGKQEYDSFSDAMFAFNLLKSKMHRN